MSLPVTAFWPTRKTEQMAILLTFLFWGWLGCPQGSVDFEFQWPEPATSDDDYRALAMFVLTCHAASASTI